jgi:hypothetical protein
MTTCSNRSLDASNCYNRISNPMASLIFKAFSVPAAAIKCMLGAIENMKLFLQMGFSNLTFFAGGGISIKTQGFCQGDGAAPVGWGVVSICISRLHNKKGHGAKFLCPITKLKHHLSAILYVNNTDLFHINLTRDKHGDDVHATIQDSINSWGNLLIATGGAL